MPRITVDGKTIEVPSGTLVVEAAKLPGVHIPVFCYHPKLEPVGMCRMCLVEIGTPKIDPTTKQPMVDEEGNPQISWMPKLQTACTTVVSEGMAVRTTTPTVREARRSVIEFLLTSHPLDCPICDKGGECPLQDHALQFGPGKSRFYFESKFHNEKSVPLSPLIMLDRERCIQCARCVRFQDEVAGEPVIGFADRGRGLEITTFDDPPFNSNFSGNTIDICPVGALTSRDFRFTARVFELTDHPSICQQCAVGCNIIIGERDNVIRRIVPRENEAVNEIWLCDKGRFVHHYAHSAERLTDPLIRIEEKLVPVSWYEALNFIGNRLRPMIIESGGKTVGGIAGDHISNEDLYLFQKLFRTVIGSGNLDHRVGWSQWNTGDELVRMFGAGVGTNLGELGRGKTVLVLGADPQNEQPVLRLRLSKATKQGATVIVGNGRHTKLDDTATKTLIYRYGREAYFIYGLLIALVESSAAAKERLGRLTNFSAELAGFSLHECAEQSGVSKDALDAAARAIAEAEHGLVLFGREFMFAMQNDPAVEAALTALVIASGHYGRENDGVIALYPHNNSMGAVDMGVLPNFGPGRLPTKDAGQSAKDMLAGKVKALYLVGVDPARENPSFRNPGLLIVQDLFLTATAQKADVVLPAASWAERGGTFTNTERRVQLFWKALEPMGHARADWEIIQDVAHQLGAKWSYTSERDIFEEIMQSVPLYSGLGYDKLGVTVRRRASVQTVGGESPEPVQIALGELSGEVSGMQWASQSERDPSFTHDVKFVVPAQTGDLPALRLVVTRSPLDQGNMSVSSRIIRERIPRAIVEVNKSDAQALGISTGDRVRVALSSKPPRTLELAARVNGCVPPGVITVIGGLDETASLPMGESVKLEKVS